jgi:hypothetical protein
MIGIIPPVPHYAFMAWCSVKAQEQPYLTLLREEHKLGVFESRMMRIFGPKREEVAGG